MDKSVIMFFAVAFELIGNFVPMLWGDNDFFSTASIVAGMVGGIFGVWVGVKVSKRFEF